MNAPPLHRRILEDLATEIRSGAWLPGRRLPTEHELMQRYGCARATVNRAVHALATQGLVERRRKAGTFVARPALASTVLSIPDIRAEIEARGLSYRWVGTGSRIQRRGEGGEDEAALRASGPLLAVSGLHFADGRPFALEHRLINPAAAAGAADVDFRVESPGAWLLSHIAWTDARHQISAVNPQADEARRLAIPRSRACLALKRWTWRQGVGITFARQLFPGDGFSLVAGFAPGPGPA